VSIFSDPAAATIAVLHRYQQSVLGWVDPCPRSIRGECENCLAGPTCSNRESGHERFSTRFWSALKRLYHQAPKLVTLALLLGIWLTWGLVILQDRDRVRAAGEEYLRSLAFTTAQHATRSFSQVDQLARIVRWLYLDHGLDVTLGQGRNSSADLRSWRHLHVVDGGLIPQIGIIDRRGMYAASDLPDFKRVDLSDRAHFLAHKNGIEDLPFVSKPVIGRATGKASIQVSRRIDGPDGRFAGVAVASLSPDYFISKYRHLLGATGTISLVGLDGVSRIRMGGIEEASAVEVLDRPWFRDGLLHSDAGLIEYQGRSDRKTRVAAYQRLESYPLATVISMTTDQLLENHYASRRFYLFSAALMSLGLMALVVSSTLLLARARLSNLRLRASQRIAEEANRMKDQFISNVSHELRTPIHGIMGNAELLLADAANEESRESADTIFKSADHLLRIVTQLLDTARLQSGEFTVRLEPLSLWPILEEVASIHRPTALQAGLKLALEVQPEAAGRILADRLALISVLHNLVSNAIKFTSAGSVLLRVSADNGRTRIEVEDTGKGIHGKDLPRLFQRFTQLEEFNTRTTSGTGLGLALSKSLVFQMGGNLEVRSKPGHGSNFFFSLPEAADLVDSPERPAEAAGIVTQQSGTRD